MDLPLLSVINHVDRRDAVLSASQTEGDLGPSNLATTIIGERFRTSSLTAVVDIDFGADVDVDVLALRFPRDTAFPVAGTVRHMLDADGGAAGGGAALDSGPVPIGSVEGYGYHLHVPGSSVQARYWRFALDVSGVSFVDIGRAWAGPVFQPAHGLAHGDGDTWLDPSISQTGIRSGAEYVDQLPVRRLMRQSFVAIVDAERADMREAIRQAGQSSQILFVRDVSAPGVESMLGRFRAVPVMSQQSWGRTVVPFEVLESL